MSKIIILPEQVANKIAAGEVIERPASVVKELLENSIDALARNITIDIEEGGRRLIRVTDDGEGMDAADAALAFARHATSKIRSAEDLFGISTLGFRGEALSAIAAVSQVELITRAKGAPSGTQLRIEAGVQGEARDIGVQEGTSISVQNLFFNTPARRKFLRSQATETAHITDVVMQEALSRLSVHFKLTSDGRVVFDLLPAKGLRERVSLFYGDELARGLIDVEAHTDIVNIKGLISNLNETRANRSGEHIFINGRPIKNRVLSHAVMEAYKTLLMVGRYPIVFLFLEVAPLRVDVNVHPQKREVRLSEERLIHDVLQDALRGALTGAYKSQAEVMLQNDQSLVSPHRDRVQSAIAEFFKGEPVQFIPGQFSIRPRISAPKTSTAVESGANLIMLGQLHNTYLLVQDADSLLIVDQHAAGERILYERLSERFLSGGATEKELEVQPLLFPFTIELSYKEAEFMKGALNLFKEVGFAIEPYSGTTYAITATPPILDKANLKEFIHDLIEEANAAASLKEAMVKMMACHGAVRAGDALDVMEQERLLKDLFSLKAPQTCPHGRPTYLRLSKAELEKEFGRKG